MASSSTEQNPSQDVTSLKEETTSIEMKKEEEKITLFKIINLVKKLNLEEFKVAHIDLSGLSNVQIETIVKVATHCCLNGPIGVNKSITLFDLNNAPITSLFPNKITNKAWHSFCNEIAKGLIDSGKDLKGFFTIDKFGTPWPLCDNAFSKFKSETGTIERSLFNAK